MTHKLFRSLNFAACILDSFFSSRNKSEPKCRLDFVICRTHADVHYFLHVHRASQWGFSYGSDKYASKVLVFLLRKVYRTTFEKSAINYCLVKYFVEKMKKHWIQMA